MSINRIFDGVSESASLWCGELKCIYLSMRLSEECQPPCEAVSWNDRACVIGHSTYRQPPCEAVSWNFNQTITATGRIRSASLWGCELKCSRSRLHILHYSQPPCEAVSWNEYYCAELLKNNGSASLWGCELKYVVYRTASDKERSASLWGCELKCGTVDCLFYRKSVSLLVRLWVEICYSPRVAVYGLSASLWGCELK